MLVASAAAAALILRVAWSEPLAGVMVLLAIVAVLAVRQASRRRAARVLRSGDVDEVLARWSSWLGRVPHPETMGPLMTATAFAAYGWVERARQELRSAERGPAWEAALEHRLFLDALLLTFEGQTDEAAQQVRRIEGMPVPTTVPSLADRVRMLRSALGALVRAFAHRGHGGDLQLMVSASNASPLVHWAMRYGAAIVAVDAGNLAQAVRLVEQAPAWPKESYFQSFHQQILAEVERRNEVGPLAATDGGFESNASGAPPAPPSPGDAGQGPSPAQCEPPDSVPSSRPRVDEK